MSRFDFVTSLRGPRGILVLASALVLAGCATHEKLAVASGAVFPLNPDHWHPTPADLAAPDAKQ